MNNLFGIKLVLQYKMRILIVIISFFLVSWQIDSNKLEWNRNRKITWEDFKGVPKINSYDEAITSSGIEFSKTYRRDTLFIGITSYFYKINSWVKNKDASEYKLKHEQVHFDISEIYARKLKKEISQLLLSDTINKKYLDFLFDKFIIEMNEYQDLYDKETNHSINNEKQLEWNNKIEYQLNELEQWSQYQPSRKVNEEFFSK